ncbi:MAG: type II toxin-antitoxin system prevent-host-death family antitoxin [Nitrospirales bacterium]
MPEVGAYDAKTHLPQLLERTQKGEHFVITKHGRPVAELVPVSRTDGDTVRRTIKNIRSFRETLRKRGVQMQGLLKKDETLRDLAHQEHRF